jgi:hypothetical protein
MSTAVSSPPPIFLSDVECNFPEKPSLAHVKRAALLKQLTVSERLVEVRTASRLEVRPRPEMISSGVAEVDALTGGGIPRGCLTEIWGPPSSGKTSLLIATIASATRRREACVLIDASDSFDPASGQAAGIDFGKLFWVRCGGKACVAGRALCGLENQSQVGCRASHGKGKQNPASHDARRTTRDIAGRVKKSSEQRLEQVLKATDLILQSGGLGLIVLDLAGIEEKFVRRIPLASWFRFQCAVEHTKSALLVVSEPSCAQTCAALSLKMEQPSTISVQSSAKPAHAELLEKIPVQAAVTRSRLDRKPLQPATRFETQAVRFG